MALKHLVDLDLGGNEIQNVVLQNLGTAPTGSEGQIYYDTAANCVKVHTGSGFVRVGLTADGSTITESNGTISVGTIAISNVTGLQTALNGKATTANIAILNSGGTPELGTGITAGEVRGLIGAGTSNFSGAYSALSGVPTSFTPSSHTHPMDEVDGLNDVIATLAPLASPALTGTPTAPTAAGGNSSTQIATTAFVAGEITRVVDAAPAALDTLNEIAASLNDDADFAGTMTTALAAKLNESAYTAADVLAKIKTVDGAGSGLDADKLDGQSSAYYRNYNNLTNTPDIPALAIINVTGEATPVTVPLAPVASKAIVQVYETSTMSLVMTEITQVNDGEAVIALNDGVDYTVIATGRQ